MANKAEIFISYSHEDGAYLKALETHLALLRRQGLIETWHDRDIPPGASWADQIRHRLEGADIILLLVSPDFLASDFCWDQEMTRALDRHDRGEAKVVPILLRPCDWKTAPFARIQGLPKDLRPISAWPSADEAWLDVVNGLRRVLGPIAGVARRSATDQRWIRRRRG